MNSLLTAVKVLFVFLVIAGAAAFLLSLMPCMPEPFIQAGLTPSDFLKGAVSGGVASLAVYFIALTAVLTFEG